MSGGSQANRPFVQPPPHSTRGRLADPQPRGQMDGLGKRPRSPMNTKEKVSDTKSDTWGMTVCNASRDYSRSLKQREFLRGEGSSTITRKSSSSAMSRS